MSKRNLWDVFEMTHHLLPSSYSEHSFLNSSSVFFSLDKFIFISVYLKKIIWLKGRNG